MNNQNKAQFDYFLLLIILLLMIISTITIQSSQKFLPYSANFTVQQVIRFIVGLVMSSVIYYFDFEQIKRM